jgi:hypothetical protein
MKTMERAIDIQPSKSLILLIIIGLIDLIATALLHAEGMIVELNPIMRPIIEHGEWLFALVKGMTLLVAYLTMVNYARQNADFVRRASQMGILLYTGIWLVWFTAAA